jgi:hypothetical protein
MEVNFPARSASFVHKAPEIVSAAVALANSKIPAKPNETPTDVSILLVRTPDKVLVLNLHGKKTHTYYLPHELRSRTLDWYEFAAGSAIAIAGTFEEEQLYRFGPAGKVVGHESIRLVPPTAPKERAAERRAFCLETMSTAAPCGLLPGFCGCVTCAERGLVDAAIEQGKHEIGPVTVDRPLFDQWPGLLATAVLSAFWAWLCFRQQRKYGLRSTWLWTTFVFLFGLPAYVGYRTHRKWAVRLPCPSCGRVVPRDRPTCTGCGHDFPPPALKGIEVFA